MTSLSKPYAARKRIRPLFLRGDFDGDGTQDYAVAIERGARKGLAICRSATQRPIVIGAGIEFHGWQNLDFTSWEIHSKFRRVGQGVEAGRPPKLVGDAILLVSEESGSGLIYWNGRQFVWYQQGD